MKTAVITGATGVIGLSLIDELYKSGYEIYAVCRKNSSGILKIKEQNKSNIIECDISNLSNLTQLIKKNINVFYHLAWTNTFGITARNDMESQIKNIQYCIDAVNVAKELGCTTFIGVGSQAEYGRCETDLAFNTPTNPENGYGIAKLAAGKMSAIRAKELNMNHIWVRVLSVYGVYETKDTFINSTIKKMLKGEHISCTKCEQQWDYLYSKDVARALMLIAEKPVNQSVYVLGSGEKKPLKYFIDTIKKNIGECSTIGYGEIKYTTNQVMNLCADIRNLTRDTGFKPRYSFEEGIRETIEWIKEIHKNEKN